jgi:hypothetical protein
LAQLTATGATLFFRPDARLTRTVPCCTSAVMPGRLICRPMFRPVIAVHDRVSPAATGALRIATPSVPLVTLTPVPAAPMLTFKLSRAIVSRPALSSCSPVAALPSPSRSTSTAWRVMAKFAEPVRSRRR